MQNTSSLSDDRNATDNVSISVIVRVLLLTESLWIIVSHSVIMFCFFTNRAKQWTNYTMLTLSLSFNDLLLGVVYLLIYIMISLPGDINYILCACVFYMFFVTQSASLYQVFGICVFRAHAIFSETRLIAVNQKILRLIVALSWTTAFCACVIPFLLWADYHDNVPHCLLDFLLPPDSSALMFMTFIYIFPMLFTNIIYCVTCLKLIAVLRRLFRSVGVEIPSISTPNTTEHLQFRERSIKVQRTTLATIGLLLVLFDIFTVPIIVALGLRKSQSDASRNAVDLRIVTVIMYGMNSAISPFVYAMRAHVLRTALANLIKKFVISVRR